MNSVLKNKMSAIGAATGVCMQFDFPDGSSIRNGERAPDVAIRFRKRRAQWRTALFGHVGFLESYFDGDIDIDGDLALAFRAALDAGFDKNPNPLVAIRNRWHEFLFGNGSIAQAKANARKKHYGLGNEFYRFWLDKPAMMYTCAYWKEGTKTLEEAQRNKMDHVCRKVQLKAGETFADVGCGWGGLLFHAWENFGALGTGINTTTEQVEEARREIERRGLAGKLNVIESDFRRAPGQFDKLLSIGCLEHAGRDNLPDVIRTQADLLKPGGLGVIHFIGHVGEFDTDFFIRKHIFPGGWIPSLARVIECAEQSGLEVLDVENLRRHYALTLDEWAARFDRNWEEIRSLDPVKFDESFRRKWRSYLYSCAELFRSPKSRTHLFQVLVSKGNVGAKYPMTRSYFYPPAL